MAAAIRNCLSLRWGISVSNRSLKPAFSSTHPLSMDTLTCSSYFAATPNWYSNQGLLTASCNAFGQVFSAIYDVKNRATNTVGSTGVAINQTFDLLDRLSTRAWPDNG